jgi:hypothetical protein
VLEKLLQKTASTALRDVQCHGQSFELLKDPNGPKAYEPTHAALQRVIESTDSAGSPKSADADAEKAKARHQIKCRAETQRIFLHLLTTEGTYADRHIQAHITSILNNASNQEIDELGWPGAEHTSAYAIVEALVKRAPEGDAAYQATKSAMRIVRAYNSGFPTHARQTVTQYIKANTTQYRKWGCNTAGKFAEEGSIKVPLDSETRGLTAYVCLCHIQEQSTPAETQQCDRVLKKAMDKAGMKARTELTWSVLRCYS